MPQSTSTMPRAISWPWRENLPIKTRTATRGGTATTMTPAELYLLSSRWYNPEIRRFMTRDEYRGEAANPISMHRYAYCGNDPVKEGSIGWAHGV